MILLGIITNYLMMALIAVIVIAVVISFALLTKWVFTSEDKDYIPARKEFFIPLIIYCDIIISMFLFDGIFHTSSHTIVDKYLSYISLIISYIFMIYVIVAYVIKFVKFTCGRDN